MVFLLIFIKKLDTFVPSLHINEHIGSTKSKWQGMRESNSQQWFWRPLLYHLTNPLYVFVELILS